MLESEQAKEEKIQKYITELEKDYSDMLEVYKSTKFNKVLYRGMDDEQVDFGVVKGKIRKNRQPLFMPSVAHELISNILEEMGLASRRNSLFCTGSKHITNDWSDHRYVLFVSNGWNGLVFQEVKENYSYDYLFDVYDEFINKAEISDEENEKKLKDLLRQKIKELRPKAFRSKEDLLGVLNEGYEDILITGDNYIGLQYEPNMNRLSCQIIRTLLNG
jgi:hypothetical protein